MTTIEQVQNFILENFLFGDSTKMPSVDASFLQNGIVDSTGMLEVIRFLEETFSITVEDNELLPENLDSFKNIEKYIARKLG